MTRCVMKGSIGISRYVGLYCNTIDEMVSPMFEDYFSFADWLNANWRHENEVFDLDGIQYTQHRYWIKEAMEHLATRGY